MDAAMRKKTVPLPAEPVPARAQATRDRLAYGVENAAAALGLSRSRIYELIAGGEIAVCKVGKRTIIPATELRAFLDRHRVARLPGRAEERR